MVQEAMCSEYALTRSGTGHTGRAKSKYPKSAAWSYTSAPQYAFMVWCSVQVQGKLYLYLT